ncbi:psbQ-like 1 [Wolffia australiana]
MAAALMRTVGASQIVNWRAKPANKLSAKTMSPTAEDGAVQSGRRAALLLSAGALFQNLGLRTAMAAGEQENNGFWLTSPLPVPSVDNKTIANSETGTRSFLRKGIYIAEIGTAGTAFRVKHYAFDLLALEDMLGADILWNYFSKYLCLKATVMYYDFDKLISATAATTEKQSLADLATRLFDNVEKLEDAVKKRSETQTRETYAGMKAILQEVMARMA